MTRGVVSGPTCRNKKKDSSLFKDVLLQPLRMCVTVFQLTLQPSSLQEDSVSFQYLHWAAMEITLTVALTDLTPGSTIGFMTR